MYIDHFDPKNCFTLRVRPYLNLKRDHKPTERESLASPISFFLSGLFLFFCFTPIHHCLEDNIARWHSTEFVNSKGSLELYISSQIYSSHYRLSPQELHCRIKRSVVPLESLVCCLYIYNSVETVPAETSGIIYHRHLDDSIRASCTTIMMVCKSLFDPH